jgi:alkanesulfonate monooxygenase SsuD/methylene tetrahydromethanopterin reductase-like flavin-dependent oxidoreductase (luciferase family)
VKPIGRLEESIRIFKALWESGGQPVSRESEFWPLTNAVFPIPQYEGRNPQLLMVGGTEKLLALTGELCDGWLTFMPGGAMDDVGLLAQMIEAVKSAASAAGKDPEQMRFVAQVFASIAETDERAWELARKPPVGWLGVIGARSGGAAWKKWGYEIHLGTSTGRRVMDITRVDGRAGAELVDASRRILDPPASGAPERRRRPADLRRRRTTRSRCSTSQWRPSLSTPCTGTRCLGDPERPAWLHATRCFGGGD